MVNIGVNYSYLYETYIILLQCLIMQCLLYGISCRSSSLCKCCCESMKRNLQFSKTVCFDVSPCSKWICGIWRSRYLYWLFSTSFRSQFCRGGLFPLLQEKGGGLDLKCDRLVFVMRGECLDFVDGIKELKTQHCLCLA